ncbi:NAD(P) transhydrogenase subunit alpha [Actinomycetota bacterium]|nr:NAD(P) transhydrogenase subunit alpha [Actinomycetota bacterium]
MRFLIVKRSEVCYTIDMSITIGFIDETSEFEARVGLTPDVAKRLIKTFAHPEGKNVELLLEKGAGALSYYDESEYADAGVKLVSRADALKADYVGFIAKPDAKTIGNLKKGQTAVGLFGSFADEQIGTTFTKQGVRAVDVNRLPRQLSMAQSMDAITSQNSVAGYKAVLLAANEYAGFFPMLTTAAGTIKPASVLVLGAGIAGLQAIGTARRLGAVVTAFDVRPAAEEEIKSLGAKFLDLAKYGAEEVSEALKEGQGDGGYARQLTADELKAQKEATDRALVDFDVVITTAQVPGKKPPEFISKVGLKNLKPGSVVVDLAASTLGGNVEGSKPEQTVEIDGVKLIGAPTLASSSAKAASNLLARNITDVIAYFATKTDEELSEFADMVIAGEKPKLVINHDETDFTEADEEELIEELTESTVKAKDTKPTTEDVDAKVDELLGAIQGKRSATKKPAAKKPAKASAKKTTATKQTKKEEK